MPTTFYVFNLGFSPAVLDPTEGNSNNEGASVLVGQTFGSLANPLRNTLVQFSPVSFVIGTVNAYDVNNTAATDTFSINGGPAQSFDAYVTYSATITYTDGTTAIGPVEIIQTTTGQLYAVPGTTSTVLLTKPVASFTLTSVQTFDNANMLADRPVIGSGTGGADALPGTAVSDYLEGYNGNDTLSGGDGNDALMGGAGDDSIAGGNANDTLFGDAGNDTLSGDAGADSLFGGAGNDSLGGGIGADTLTGGIGSDTLRGGDDADLITGDGAENLLVNGSFEQNVAPNNANFYTIIGGWTNGNGGTIEVWGNGLEGEGNATDGGNFIELDNGAAVDSIRQDVQTVSGESYTLSFSAQQRGTMTDTIEVYWRGALIGTITPTANWATYSFTVTGSGGLDRLEFREPAGQSSSFGPLMDNVQLVGANPLGGADSLDGGAGNDTIRGGIGNDTIDGGIGNDSIEGEAGDDSLSGGDNNDTLQDGAGRDLLAGGAGIDRLEGGTGADTFVADGSADTVIDFDVTTGTGNGNPSDNDFVDLTGFYNNATLAAWNAANPGQTFGNALAWMRFDAQDGVLNQAGGLRLQNGGTAVAAGGLSAENTGVICFALGTAILTDRGEVKVEALRAGDRVWTLDSGFQPIRWIGASFVPAMDRNAPVVIEAGVLGNHRLLRVSPQHRMLLDGPEVELHFAAESVLVPAKALVDGAGIRREPALFAQYFHILLDRHEVLLAEGALSESFLPAAEGWKTLSPACRAGLLEALPDLSDGGFAAYGPTARPVLTVAEGRLLAALMGLSAAKAQPDEVEAEIWPAARAA